MISLYYLDIAKMFVVAVTYMLCLDIHRVLLPNSYSTIYEFIYEENTRKTVKSTSIRIIIIMLLSLLFYKICKFNLSHIVCAIVMGAFLKVWPSLVQYRLLLPKNKSKVFIALEYYSFIISSGIVSYIMLSCLYPILFERKEFYILSNDGVGVIYTLISFILPLSIDGFLSKNILNTTYNNIATFKEDVKIVSKQIELERFNIDIYKYEIEKYSLEVGIDEEILRTILLLENINRGSWTTRLIEKTISRIAPKIAIKKDITVGMAQIKISTAKVLLKENPIKFIDNLNNNDFNIYVCAKYLRSIIDKYELEGKMQRYSQDFDVFEYIANEYLCGSQITDNKNAMIYSAILRARFKIYGKMPILRSKKIV